MPANQDEVSKIARIVADHVDAGRVESFRRAMAEVADTSTNDSLVQTVRAVDAELQRLVSC